MVAAAFRARDSTAPGLFGLEVGSAIAGAGNSGKREEMALVRLGMVTGGGGCPGQGVKSVLVVPNLLMSSVGL